MLVADGSLDIQDDGSTWAVWVDGAGPAHLPKEGADLDALIGFLTAGRAERIAVTGQLSMEATT